MTQPTPNLISIQDLSYAYQGESALTRINLDVRPGEYLGVIGPNGGGKTTLIKLMLGLLPLQTGSVELFGQPLTKFRDWARIGYVAQHATGIEAKLPITVQEVVALGRVARAGLGHRLTAADHAAVTAALTRVDLLDLRHRLITELSGGQRQRVFIAKALAAEPAVLILDEPTIGIDVKSQDDFYQLLSQLNRQDHLTLVMVSHDIDVVVGEVTRLACINETLIYHGKPQEFVKGDYLANLYGKNRKLIIHGH